MQEETIYALGTGAGRAAIAVIRLSGNAVPFLLEQFTGAEPIPRLAQYVRLRDPATDETLDRGLALFFPAPHSPTGEDYAELQCHGGRAVVSGIISALARQKNLRPAEAGEFVQRGFRHGKLDLSQAEGLADLIEAETQSQARQALRLSGGALRRTVETWRGALIGALAQVEAELDFSDEGDVGGFSISALAETLKPLCADMARVLAISPASERMKEGYEVMILGPPNAGKSTLINRLADREIAIVTPQPGTTRDMLEAHLDFEGMPITLIDTAGLRSAEDEIEKIGIGRMLERARTADLILWLSPDGSSPPAEIKQPVLSVTSKSDLLAQSRGGLEICALTGVGLDKLCKEIAALARVQLGDGGSALFSRQRHRSATQEALEAVQSALTTAKPLELIADDLRLALRKLGKIIGVVDVEEILGVIFSRFCIGK